MTVRQPARRQKDFLSLSGVSAVTSQYASPHVLLPGCGRVVRAVLLNSRGERSLDQFQSFPTGDPDSILGVLDEEFQQVLQIRRRDVKELGAALNVQGLQSGSPFLPGHSTMVHETRNPRSRDDRSRTGDYRHILKPVPPFPD